jgi:hypothetical protein
MSLLDIPQQVTFKVLQLFPWDTYEITWPEIITIVSWEIFDRVKWTLKTFESSAYYCWKIEARTTSFLTIVSIKDKNILLNGVNVEAVFWEFCRKNWKSLFDLTGNEEHKKVDLYRSEQEEYKFMWTKYKFNFWFCGKNVNCLFHNEHNFIEIHTWIAGDWYMQKSIDWTEETLVEVVWILPWTSHRPFAIWWEFEENWNPKYPFHRWFWWTTWNVWLVIEKY